MGRPAIDPRFRAVLVALILETRASQNRIAAAAHISHSYLSQLVNGERSPSPQVVRALDRALHADGQLTDLLIAAASPDDRDLLVDAVANPRRVGPDTIDALTRVLAGQRHLDDVAGSATMLGPVAAQMAAITTMVVEVAGPTRPDLLYVAAQWAQFCGWLHTSLGKWPDARVWFARAAEWATEHGDRDLLATTVSYQAHVAWLTCQWAPAVGLARAALRDPAVYPGQRAYDAYAAARGLAALGEVDAALPLLDFGDQLADATNRYTGAVPAWQYYRAPWLWRLERGLVWLYVARHRPVAAAGAVADLTAGLEGMPPEMRGADWAAEYMGHLGSALMVADDLDEAGAVLDRARFVAEATGSGRVLQLVRGRQRRLAGLRRGR
jgi:transcriptional regulator with XRE-family HTH domain